MLNLSGNLEVNAGAPLDARTVVPTVADLTIASNFQYKYVGMPVVVQATGDMYILLANDVTDIANWKLSGSGGGGSSYTAGDGIVIEDDEISTDNMPAADMSEIVTPLPSVMSRLPVLFDETGTERQVGWYKNSAGLKKPVYEVDLTINNVGNWAWNTTALVGYDIEKIVYKFAWFDRLVNQDRNQFTEFMHATNDYITAAITPKGYAFGWSGGGSMPNIWLRLQFTKTTDTFS